MGSLITLIMPMGWVLLTSPMPMGWVLITLPTPMGWVLITSPMPMGWGGYHFTHAQGALQNLSRCALVGHANEKLAKNESAARPAFLAPSPAGWAPFAVGACPTGPGALFDHKIGVLNSC